jgi:hypothetical protein
MAHLPKVAKIMQNAPLGPLTGPVSLYSDREPLGPL